MLDRRNPRLVGLTAALAVSALGTGAIAQAAAPEARSATPAVAEAGSRVGSLDLLTDPFLQAPTDNGVSVVWMTEYAGQQHVVLVGQGVGQLTEQQLEDAAGGQAPAGIRAFVAESSRLSRVSEDAASQLAVKPAPAEGIVAREVHRHEASVSGLSPASETPYRVVSTAGGELAASGVFELSPAAAPGQAQRILLTSDHQAMVNTPANLQMARETIGDIDAVFVAGDLVNIPDRASEWFDDTRGSAFFPVLQGRGARVSTGGVSYVGGEIIQNAPLFPAVGNHEVQGRRAGMTSLNTSFNAPVPTAVAERRYAKVAAEVNPTGDPAVEAAWIEDNSFSTRTYEEMFTLPDDGPGGETYYATTVGDVRLVSLFATRIWRGTSADPDPSARTATSRYQEAAANLGDPMAQGYGEHVFESLEVGSEQLAWLEEELASPEFQGAPTQVVMLHEGPQGLGDNVMPVFAHPERIETRNAAGELTSVVYEYRTQDNMLVRDLQPLLEGAGADLVLNGHSHLWNRFRSRSGTNFLETSNTGNSYGAYHGLSNRKRPLPPEPWDRSNYLAIGNPGGLKPIVPNVAPFTNPDGVPLPFVQSNDLAVFSVLDTGTNEVVSWAFDVKTPERAPWVIDRFAVGDARTTTTASVSRTKFGLRTRVTGSVESRRPVDGVITISAGRRELTTARVVDGAFTARLPARALRPGRHTLEVSFPGATGTAPSDATVALRVRRAAPTIRASVRSRQGPANRVVRVAVRVAARGVVPRGAVRAWRGRDLLGTATLARGSAVLRVPVRALGRPGRKTVRLVYVGSSEVSARSTRLAVRVRR